MNDDEIRRTTMTTKLEKQFFDTFGIEPMEIPSREYDSNGEICSYYVEYPQITDRILLELICLLNTITHPDLGDVYVEKLKTTVLQEYLKMFDSDLWENEEKAKKEFIEQVQALFEEG